MEEDEKDEEEKGGGDKAKKGKDQNVKYLYFELLKLAESGSSNQVNELQKDLKVLEKKQQNDWNELIKWNIPNLPNKSDVRQDRVPNGIVSQYSYNKLTESSESTFNSPNFYDYNQYLSQLVLLAHVVDQEFQESVQSMYSVDKITGKGKVPCVESTELKSNNGDGYVKYSAGPIKLIDRARAKAQNDYANEPYPASACVLDLNRYDIYIYICILLIISN